MKIKTLNQGGIRCTSKSNSLTRPEIIERSKASHDNLNVYLEDLRKTHIDRKENLRKSVPRKKRAENSASFMHAHGDMDTGQRRQNTEIGQFIPHPPPEPHRSTTPNHQLRQCIDKHAPYNIGRAYILYCVLHRTKHSQKHSEEEMSSQAISGKGALSTSYAYCNGVNEKENVLNKSVMVSNISHSSAIDNIEIKQVQSAAIDSKKSLNVLQECQSTDPTYSLQKNYATLEPEGIEDVHNGFVMYYQKRKRLLCKLEKAHEDSIIS